MRSFRQCCRCISDLRTKLCAITTYLVEGKLAAERVLVVGQYSLLDAKLELDLRSVRSSAVESQTHCTIQTSCRHSDDAGSSMPNFARAWAMTSATVVSMHQT